MDTSLSSTWGDWIIIAQGDSPRLVSQGSLLCVTFQPLLVVEHDKEWAGDSRWVHSHPVRRVGSTIGQPRRCSSGADARDDWGWSDPSTLLGTPPPLFRRAAHRLPVAGLLVGGQGACRHVTPGKPGCGQPLRWYRGPGPVRASVLLSRVLTEVGVTPAVHLRGPAPLAASPSQPVRNSGKYLQNSLCPAGRGEQTPTPVNLRCNWTHLVMQMHQQRAS